MDYSRDNQNWDLEFDEKLIAEHLEHTWNGAVLAAAQEE